MDQPQARRAVALKIPRKLPRVLTVAEMQAVLDACDRLRDRFLFALLYETGGSARRWASAMKTWLPPSARWRWCPGTTATRPAANRGSRARSRSAPG
jgi:integrase